MKHRTPHILKTQIVQGHQQALTAKQDHPHHQCHVQTHPYSFNRPTGRLYDELPSIVEADGHAKTTSPHQT